MQYVVRNPNTTLDEIVYQHYGSSFRYLETVLKANRELVKESIFLTEGLIIELPEVAKTAKTRGSLWN